MFDYVIKNAILMDGTGMPSYQAAVYIKGNRIAAIDSDPTLPSWQTIDAAGFVAAPGFMDMHTHSDATPYCAPNFESALSQGLTFHLAGNCGGSLVPNNTPQMHEARAIGQSRQKFKIPISGSDYKAVDVSSMSKELEQRGLAINLGTVVGHANLRGCVMKDPGVSIPTDRELDEMADLLDQQLDQGAFGMSLGLVYAPGLYTKTEELIRMARVVARHNAILPIHMRSEGARLFEAVDEVRRIAEESGAHVHISHLKLMYAQQWGRADELLRTIDDMRTSGITITCDQYPYSASSTGFTGLLPKDARKGSNKEMAVRLRNDAYFEAIRAYITDNMAMRGGPSRIGVAYTCGTYPQCDGKTLETAAQLMHLEPVDAYRQILIASECNAACIYYAMDERDVMTIARRRDIAVVSDGFGYDNISDGPAGKPHPRSAGSFARFLRLVREEKLMSMEEAVHKMTGLPAKNLGIKDRGNLKVGNYADIVIFDPTSITDHATFDAPAEPASGIKWVFVNGVPAWKDKASLQTKNGQFLLFK